MDIYILGTGSYVPEKILSNKDLEKILDTSDEWITQRTGIKERRVAAPDETSSDLALKASLRAFEMAEMSVKEIDLIVMATITPDTHCPAAANWLQAKLDAPQAFTFDVTAACSGFIFALNVAEQYLKTGAAKKVLVVASEIMTRVLNWKDRTTCILWGDGAGAMILSSENSSKKHRLISSHIHTDGANGDTLLMPGGGSATTPISHESVDKDLHTLKMINANQSVRVAVRHFTESCIEAAETNGLSISEIDWFIPHQANIRILQSIAKKLKVSMEKVYVNIHKYGNISSATVPIAFDEAVRGGYIKKGHKVILTAFGGGLTWGSALIEW